MNVPLQVPLMTAEEFLALPDEEGVERWLIDGRLYEKRYRDKTMTYRNRWHGRLEARVAYLLGEWLENSDATAEIYFGEAGCLLQRTPDIIVGIDVVYFAQEPSEELMEGTRLLVGVPTLAVEVLSPFDTEDEINLKLDKYRQVRVPLVWLVDPHDETITVYRPEVAPVLFTIGQELTAEPELPGFRVLVLRFFHRRPKAH